ncbi:YybH family protein [Blastopirellula marina]|nr:SgcJ/EcaC family oxidoreductase [Blastopirellula marina]
MHSAARAVMLVALLAPIPVFGAEEDAKTAVATDQSDDLAAIREQSTAFETAFNQGDAAAISALWTTDGQYVDDAGRSFTGRKEIEAAYADLFKQHSGSKIQIAIDSLRLLSSDAALEEGRALTSPTAGGEPGFSAYSAVHVKVDGKWLMASVRDHWVAVPSAHHNVSDLEWLIGKWTAEEYGNRVESDCRWIANKSFVERTYTTIAPGGAKVSGVQIIGWSPVHGCMQSWNFSADGGHAVGLWTPIEGGFMAEMRGVTGGGVPTQSVNTLTKLDENAYVWQSTARSIGGAALPDTDEVIIKRQTSQP